MFYILGFYKFKKLYSLKNLKRVLNKLLTSEFKENLVQFLF